jgi:S-(hydroxymethyl)glutathione dehydrogenase / alcohol dehydrogenase
MKAAILVESKAPLVFGDLSVPELDVGQVLVRVFESGICGAQINEIDAVKGVDKFLPHLLGHEGGGIVEKVGPGVSAVKVGDHVVLHWRKGVGIQGKTATYNWAGQKVNSGWVTTFSELTVVSENRVTPIPKSIPFDIAALMGCAVTTALGLINNLAQIKIGQSIVVFGCGGVGLSILQGAAMVSADPIIAIDLHDSKLDVAKKFGATHTINSKTQNAEEEIKNVVGSAGVDVAVDNTGNTRVIELAYRITASKGRTILVGVPKHNEDITIHSLPLHFGKVLTGCEGGNTDPSTDIPRYLKLYERGKLSLDKLITNRFEFGQINDAFSALRAGEIPGRCMVTVQK